MTTRTAPTRHQLTEDQYIGDLANLFRRYKLGCGTPVCLRDLGAQLETNAGLRGDLFNLCTAISHMGETDLSPEQLLRLIARAAGGPQFADPETEIPALTNTAFLKLYQERSDAMWGAMDPDLHEPARSPEASAESVWDLPVGRFYAASARTIEEPASKAGNLRESRAQTPAEPGITPETRIGELTISELRGYLDQVESRVARLRPYFASVERTGEGIVGLGGDGGAFAETVESVEDRAAPILDRTAADSGRSLPVEVPRAEVWREDRVLAPASHAETSSAEMEQVPTLAMPVQAREETGYPELVPGRVHEIHAEDDALVVPLPLQADFADATSPTIFGAVPDAAKDGSRMMGWLSAAVVLIGFGAGFGYKYIHRLPENAPPALSVPAVTLAPESAPATQALPPNQDLSTRAATARVGTAGATQKTLPQRSRIVGSQPRLLPREIRMEADAARAQEGSAGTPRSNVPTQPPAPIVRSGQPAPPGTSSNEPQ